MWKAIFLVFLFPFLNGFWTQYNYSVWELQDKFELLDGK